MTTAERLRVLARFLEQLQLPDDTVWPSITPDSLIVQLFASWQRPVPDAELAASVAAVADGFGTATAIRPLREGGTVHETHVPYRGTTIHVWATVHAEAPAAVA